MIQVVIWKDSGQQIRGIDLDGHAGYGEEGEDIVCAAVSALVLNMANSVEAFTEDGFSFRFTGEISPESKLLMDSLILGLNQIREEYGEQYINIRLKEV